MVGDALGAILWVMPCSVSQEPMVRAPTLPPITNGAGDEPISDDSDDSDAEEYSHHVRTMFAKGRP